MQGVRELTAMNENNPSKPLYPHQEGREVLLVEDESRLRDMWTRAVQEMGFRVRAVATAEAGLKLIDQQHIDIVLLDLNLPGMGGMEFLDLLRQRRPGTQVIILTGFGDLEAAKRAIHLDVVDFLTKPCPLDELELALDRARARCVSNAQSEAAAEAPPKNFQFAAEPESVPAGLSLEELEQKHILAVLEKHAGNRAATAAELGISLRKLYYRLGQYQKQGLIP